MSARAPEPDGDAASWQRVPEKASELAQGLFKLAQVVRLSIGELPLEQLDVVLYSPQSKEAAILLMPGTREEDGLELVGAVAPHVFYPWLFKSGEGPDQAVAMDPWIPIARGTALPDTQKVAQTFAALDDRLFELCKEAHEKVAAGDHSATIRSLGELAGYLPGGHYSWQIPGAPHYLQGALGGALLGAGLGYGTGWLGSRVLPKTWDRSRLPKTMAILGSMAGAAPGMAAILSSAAKGSAGVDDALFNDPPPDLKSYQKVLPSYPHGPQSPAEFHANPEYNASAPLPASIGRRRCREFTCLGHTVGCRAAHLEHAPVCPRSDPVALGAG
jgi:hypothetical protein